MSLLSYLANHQIKLRTTGYRLAYEVIDSEVVVYVLAIGKREKNEVYNKLKKRK